MVHIVWLPLVQLAQFKEHKMKKLLFVLVTVLFLIGPADAQWGTNLPAWYEFQVVDNEVVTTTSSSLAGTAADDSLTAFTVSGGDIYITGLSMNTTVGAGATSEVLNFILDTGTYGTTITRVGLGKDLNDLALGIVQFVNPATAVLTDSLGYYRTATMVSDPVVEIIQWRIRVQSGTIIKLNLPGSSTTTRVACTLVWQRAVRGSAATVTAG